MKTKLLSSSDIESILLRVGTNLLLDTLTERLHQGFSKLDLTKTQIPIRSGLYYTEPDLGLIEWMPAAETFKKRATLKIVGYHPTNPDKRALPTILSTLYAFDTDTGHLRGILDGTFPTSLRTGAISAVVSAKLAPQDRSITLGIIGSGAQSVTQAHALSRVLPIEKIVVYDKNPNAAASFQKRISFLSIPVKVIEKEELPSMLATFDVLCTCTSEEPGSGSIISDFHNKTDLHINAVGSDFPEKFELPLSLLKRAFVCPDFIEQALIEGECQQLDRSEIGPDVADFLREPTSVHKERSQSLTVFDSTGHAYSDYITTHLFLDYANEFKLGSDIDLESVPTDPLNPYSFLTHPLSEKTVCCRENKALTK